MEDQTELIPVNGKTPVISGDPSLRMIVAEIIYKTIDAKTFVIFSVLLIVIVAIYKVQDPKEIITNALSGLFGVAVGRSTR